MTHFYTVTVIQDEHIFWYRSDGEHKSTCFRGLWLIQSTMWTGFHVFWARTHCSVCISGWVVVHNKWSTRCHSTVTCSFQNAPQTCVKLSLPHAFPQNLFLTIQAFLISAPVRIGLPLLEIKFAILYFAVDCHNHYGSSEVFSEKWLPSILQYKHMHTVFN